MAPYGISKLCGEHYVELYNRLYGTRHVILRYGNVYGPRQDPHGEAGVVAIFFGQLLEGATPLVFGDGRQTRDYVYVGDVVAANLAALDYDGAHGSSTSAPAARRASSTCWRPARRRRHRVEPEHRPARLGELERSAWTARWPSASWAGGPRRDSPTASPRRCARSPADRIPRPERHWVRPTGRREDIPPTPDH